MKNIANSELVVIEEEESKEKVKAELKKQTKELPVAELLGETKSEDSDRND